MISRAEVDKLLSTRAERPVVLSLYLPVPLDPAELRGVPATIAKLVAAAEHGHPGGPGAIRVPDGDKSTVRGLLDQHGRDWLGHTAAIFVCGELGLAEGAAVADRLAERAVLATRPHVRPLLVSLQRRPAYHAAVIDRRHAWVFHVAGERIDTVAQPVGRSVRSPGFGGWYGLQAHRIHERIIQLSRHHYRETAAILERATGGTGQEPFVLGGHEEGIPPFLALLPPSLRDRFAGSFVADPHTFTPARVRELSAPVIERWVRAGEQRLAAGIAQSPPGGLTATGMRPCVRAVNQHAVQILAVPDDGLVPGFACGRCGALASAGGSCPACGAALGAVADLVEEMVIKTIEDGGQVRAVQDPPDGIAARLRFPLATGDER